MSSSWLHKMGDVSSPTHHGEFLPLCWFPTVDGVCSDRLVPFLTLKFLIAKRVCFMGRKLFEVLPCLAQMWGNLEVLSQPSVYSGTEGKGSLGTSHKLSSEQKVPILL